MSATVQSVVVDGLVYTHRAANCSVLPTVTDPLEAERYALASVGGAAVTFNVRLLLVTGVAVTVTYCVTCDVRPHVSVGDRLV
jgi:hypothetical protein